MGIHKLLHKFALLAINGNGGPGGPPFEVNGFPVFPDPDEGDGKPELIEEEEYIDLENFTEEQKQIYEDLLLEIRELILEIRELRKLIPEEDEQKVKNDEEKEDKKEEE